MDMNKRLSEGYRKEEQRTMVCGHCHNETPQYNTKRPTTKNACIRELYFKLYQQNLCREIPLPNDHLTLNEVTWE